MTRKTAIISVYDKKGLIEFAKKLYTEFDHDIISTGGTCKALKKANIPVTEVQNITNFPEILDGRVKTLHPNIHAGILANQQNPSHKATLDKHNIKPIDMVIVNLYPFEEVARSTSSTEDELIENIDIGGVSLLRSAAKNHQSVTVISNPDDYDSILAELTENKGQTTPKTRKKLALKAFNHTFNYDKAIYTTLSRVYDNKQQPESININLSKVMSLRYGENPQQTAGYYTAAENIEKKFPYEVIQGKELSYNNLVDLTAALKITGEFNDKPACTIIKHNNPCGVATGNTITEAWQKALDADPVSAFGGIVSLNEEIDANLAEQLTSIFLEVIVAPSYTNEAKDIFSKKKNLRLVIAENTDKLNTEFDIKQAAGGFLIQSSDNNTVNIDDLRTVTSKSPSENELNDLMFAWKVAKHVGSNAIVIAKDGQTLGIGCGQTSRIGSMEIALRQACDGAKDAVLASDGFFPATDNIHAAAQSRISAIIQPGGSIKDKDVIEEANKMNIAMVLTGIRHFRH